MLITKAEALNISSNAQYLKNHRDEANLRRVLKELDSNIRAAAEHGQYHSVWTIGGDAFRNEIENILKASGFDVTYEEGSYLIRWEPPPAASF